MFNTQHSLLNFSVHFTLTDASIQIKHIHIVQLHAVKRYTVQRNNVTRFHPNIALSECQ